MATPLGTPSFPTAPSAPTPVTLSPETIARAEVINKAIESCKTLDEYIDAIKSLPADTSVGKGLGSGNEYLQPVLLAALEDLKTKVFSDNEPSDLLLGGKGIPQTSELTGLVMSKEDYKKVFKEHKDKGRVACKPDSLVGKLQRMILEAKGIDPDEAVVGGPEKSDAFTEAYDLYKSKYDNELLASKESKEKALQDVLVNIDTESGLAEADRDKFAKGELEYRERDAKVRALKVLKGMYIKKLDKLTGKATADDAPEAGADKGAAGTGEGEFTDAIIAQALTPEQRAELAAEKKAKEDEAKGIKKTDKDAAPGADTDSEPIRLNIVAADLEHIVKDTAAETAYESTHTEKEQKKGLSKIMANFMHNYWGKQRQFNRQKEIEQKIRETGNLNYGLEGRSEDESKREIAAVVSRFAYGDGELLNADKEETRELLSDPALKSSIKKFIEAYAKAEPGKENSDNLVTTREGLISEIEHAAMSRNGGKVEGTQEDRRLYGNNLMDAATKIRNMVQAGKKVDLAQAEINIYLGKGAKGALNTKASEKFNAIERTGEKITKFTNKYLGWAGVEMGAGQGIAAAQVAHTALSLTDMFGKSKLAAWVSFGSTAAVSGTIRGFKKGAELEEQRAKVLRDMASGKETNPKDKKRQELVKDSYEGQMKSSVVLRNTIAEGLYMQNEKGELVDKELTQEDFDHIINVIAMAEGRIILGNREGVDLFNHGPQKEEAMTNLVIEMANAKRKLANEKNSKFGNAAALIRSRADAVITGESGGTMGLEEFVRQKNKNFKTMKTKAAVKAGVTTALASAVIGGTIGAAVHEVAAMDIFDKGDHVKGLFESSDKGNLNQTFLSSVREKFFGNPDVAVPNQYHLYPDEIGEATGINGSCGSIKMPAGYFMGTPGKLLADGSESKIGILYDPDGKIMASNLEFKPDGTFTPESLAALREARIGYSLPPIGTSASVEHMNVNAHDYSEAHGTPVHRVHASGLNNDTIKFDRNELKGLITTGANGEPVLDMTHMKGPSWHGNDSMIPMQGAPGAHNVACISIDELNQGRPIIIKFGPDGKVIVPEEYRQFFTKDASGHYTSNVKYIEYASMSDTANAEGAFDIKVYATAVGPGMNNLADDVNVGTIGGVVTDLDMPANLPPAVNSLDTLVPGLLYPQGREKLGRAKDTAQKAGPQYEKATKPGEGDAEKRKSLETVTVEHGVIVIPKIKESKDGKEDKAWTKTKNDVISGVTKTLAKHSAAGTKPEGAVVMLCPEDENDSKKVQEFLNDLRNNLFKDRGVEFIFVRAEERGLTKDEILFSPYGTKLNLNVAETDTTTLYNISMNDRQSQRTAYLVKQELERRLPKFVMAPGKTPSDPKVKIMLADITDAKLKEYLAKGGGTFDDGELIAMRKTVAERKKNPKGTITPEAEPEEPEYLGTDVENNETPGSDEYFQVLLLDKKLEEFTPALEAGVEESVKKYTEGLRRGYEQKDGAGTKLDTVKSAMRKELNQIFKKVGLQILPAGEYASNRWIYWDLGKQSHFSQNKAESDDKKYNLEDPFDLTKNTEAIKSIVDRRVGLEVCTAIFREAALLHGSAAMALTDATEGRKKVLKDLGLNAVKDKDLIAKIDGLYKRTDQNKLVQDIHGYEYGEIGALLRKKAEAKAAPASPVKLTPYLEGLKKRKEAFSFDKADANEIAQIIELARDNKEVAKLRLSDAELKKDTKVFVVQATGKARGTITEDASTTAKVKVRIGPNVREIEKKVGSFYGREKIEKYVEGLLGTPKKPGSSIEKIPSFLEDVKAKKEVFNFEMATPEQMKEIIDTAKNDEPLFQNKNQVVASGVEIVAFCDSVDVAHNADFATPLKTRITAMTGDPSKIEEGNVSLDVEKTAGVSVQLTPKSNGDPQGARFVTLENFNKYLERVGIEVKKKTP